MAEKHGTVVLTDKTFGEFVSENQAAVIDCWAAWCGPCHMLSPIVEEIAGEHPEIAFGKLNVDENRKVPAKYGIMSIPTLLYFRNGRLVDKTIGAIPKVFIEERLGKLTD